MVKTEINNDKSVYGIEKSSINNRTVLKWKSSGLSAFVVFYSEKKENLPFANPNADTALQMLAENEQRFFNEKKVQFKNGTDCRYITLDDLKRDEGFQIRNRPGYYAVYGVSLADGELLIYREETSHATNVFFMTVDVVITQKPSYIRKGFFKKKEEYSGYSRVTLASAAPALVGGLLKYSIDGYSYPFPDEVVKNGGSFYVRTEENQPICFESDIQGIMIK